MVLNAAIRQIQKEMRDEVPGHAKVAEELKDEEESKIYIGFAFHNPLPLIPVLSSVSESFVTRPSYPLPFFFSF